MRHRFLSAASKREFTARTIQVLGRIHFLLVVSMSPFHGHTLHLVSLRREEILCHCVLICSLIFNSIFS